MSLATVKRSRHSTQWAAQFGVAGELCKRGYEVAFTMGNTTPEADLMVLAPEQGEMFLIDVKGQSTGSFWRIREKPQRKNLFYVLAYVPVGKANRYFVLCQSDLTKLMKSYEQSGVAFRPEFSGINWGAPAAYESKWDILPR
jgi:hypothetical protein